MTTGTTGANALLNTATPPATPPATAPATGATPPTTPPATAPEWLNGFSDEQKAFIHNKGFDSPVKLLESYQGVEKLIGKKENLMEMPAEDDPERMAKIMGIFDKLGRPEKFEDYAMEMHGIDATTPEGLEKLKVLKEKFHKAGLTRDQAADIASGFSELNKAEVEKAQAESAEKRTGEINKLKSEWGVEYDKNIALGQRAVAAYGLSTEVINNIEDGIGTHATLNLLKNMGERTREGSFVDGNSGKGDFMTKEMATSQLAELEKDSTFVGKLKSGDSAAMAKLEKLQNVAYGKVSYEL